MTRFNMNGQYQLLDLRRNCFVSFLCYTLLGYFRLTLANLPRNIEPGGTIDLSDNKIVACEVDLVGRLANSSLFPPHIRPVTDPKKVTTIYVNFELKTVMDMEEQVQILKTHCGITLDWIDEFRTWDPKEYCDLEEIDILSKELWLPDLSLLNSADEGKVFYPAPMTVKSNGDVTWDGLVIFTSFCKIDFSFFPYDEQKCELMLRAWSFPANKVLLRPGRCLEKDTTMDNGEWDVVQMTSVAKNTTRDGKLYGDLVITIHMERRPQFYFMNIIIPCVIIYCLTLFGFCLPADSGEKIGLGITILLAFVMFMLISSEMMPPNGDSLPVIAQFYTSTMVLVASSIGMSVIVLNFNHRGPKAQRAPRWMSSLLLGKLSKILFLDSALKYEEVSQDDPPTFAPPTFKEGPACIEEYMDDVMGTKSSNGNIMLVPFQSSPRVSQQSLRVSQNPILSPPNSHVTDDNKSESGKSDRKDFIEKQLLSISTNLQHLVDHHRDMDNEADVLDEWKMLAIAVDRLFLYIFLLGSTILFVILSAELMRRQTEGGSGNSTGKGVGMFNNGCEAA